MRDYVKASAEIVAKNSYLQLQAGQQVVLPQKARISPDFFTPLREISGVGIKTAAALLPALTKPNSTIARIDSVWGDYAVQLTWKPKPEVESA